MTMMNHTYQPPSTPRFAFGLFAVAMTAIMLGIFVVVPASVEAQTDDPATIAMSMRCAAGL
jgi:hypothetical protein